MSDTYDHPETLKEVPPTILVDVWDQAVDLLSSYGWYLLAVALAIIYYWEAIQSQLDQWYKEKSDREYAAMCKKDPDKMRKKQLEMEAARKRMQEELDAKAKMHAEKMKEKEEQKRAQLLARASSVDGGEKLGHGESSSAPKTTEGSKTVKKPYRPEYNPLMGSGGSGGYRPPRRGCPGGGCG